MKLLSALCFFFATVICVPVTQKQEVLRNKKSKCATIDTYTVRWFIDNAPNTRRPPPSTCLFYTYRLTEKARWYAKKHDKITIWDVWPGGYYNNDSQSKSNPLRRIMQNKKDRRTYFSNMSIAFASMCDTYALVMDANISPSTKTAYDVVNKMGIWFNEEFPALQRGSTVGIKEKVVTQIEAISPAGGDPLPYWSKWRNAYDQWSTIPADSKRLYVRSLLDGPNEELKEWWDEDLPGDINIGNYELDDPDEVPIACEGDMSTMSLTF